MDVPRGVPWRRARRARGGESIAETPSSFFRVMNVLVTVPSLMHDAVRGVRTPPHIASHTVRAAVPVSPPPV
jgi:hypothetical protein